jgi:hypothetical protein
MAQKQATGREERVIAELPAVGKYRVRLIANEKKPSSGPILDIREFVASETFEGFTRRGIRLSERTLIQALHDALGGILDGSASPETSQAS